MMAAGTHRVPEGSPMSPERRTTGLNAAVIFAMLGVLLVGMGLRTRPVAWPILTFGVLVLGMAAVQYLRRDRRPPARYATTAATADPSRPSFAVGVRGYDVAAVDELVDRARDALTRPAARRRTLVREIAGRNLAVAVRGYDRAQVDSYLDDLAFRLEAPDA
jgi:DivIVA domain-containing protein